MVVKCVETEFERDDYSYTEEPVEYEKVPITEKLIFDSLNEQLPPRGDEGKFARMVRLDIQTVTQLKLEYKSISSIDNLSNLTALTKLQLCNNVINKIENLDTLVNLVWLDLSFNCIHKIENLNALRKIEVLDLHRNFINKLENMDDLLRLEIFHISSNKLDRYENVKYLRRFARLRSASFQGNPMSKNPSFMPYLIAFVPQLTMVDYKAIPSGEREVAVAKYKTQAERLSATDDKLFRRASVVEADEKVQFVHKDAFVDEFVEDKFWATLYENDAEGNSILQLSDTDDIQIVYKELFRNKTSHIFDTGMQFFELRQNEQRAYDIATDEEMEKIQKAGNAITEEFVEYGTATLKDILILVNLKDDAEKRLLHGLISELPEEFEEYENQLNNIVLEYVKKLHNVWETLINVEVEVNEQYEDVNDLLDRSMREIFNNWMEKLREQFGSLRDVEQQLFDRFVESLVKYGEFRLSDTTIPEGLKELVMDKDALQATLQLSHDKHISVIDTAEDQHSRKLKDWLENFSVDLQVKEYQRNRARLEEISHFTNSHYGYLVETQALHHTTVYIPPIRGDQECVEEDEEEACEPLQWYERLTKRLRIKDKKFNASLNKQSKQEVKEKVKVEGEGEPELIGVIGEGAAAFIL